MNDQQGGVKILETPRLLLRRLVPQDLDALFALYADAAVTKFIPDAPKSYAETRAELEWFEHGHPKDARLGLWATIFKPTGAFIGRCGLLLWTIDGQNEVEVAYTLASAYWGQGLATEAARGILEYGFGTLNLPRLICLIDAENGASIKVATKIGMQFEKVGRDALGEFLVYAQQKAREN